MKVSEAIEYIRELELGVPNHTKLESLLPVIRELLKELELEYAEDARDNFRDGLRNL